MVERGFQPLITIKEAIENIDKIFIYYLLSRKFVCMEPRADRIIV